MILTENFEIKKTDKLTCGYIESELLNAGIVPLRWAITDENTDIYTLTVSYEK